MLNEKILSEVSKGMINVYEVDIGPRAQALKAKSSLDREPIIEGFQDTFEKDQRDILLKMPEKKFNEIFEKDFDTWHDNPKNKFKKQIEDIQTGQKRPDKLECKYNSEENGVEFSFRAAKSREIRGEGAFPYLEKYKCLKDIYLSDINFARVLNRSIIAESTVIMNEKEYDLAIIAKMNSVFLSIIEAAKANNLYTLNDSNVAEKRQAILDEVKQSFVMLQNNKELREAVVKQANNDGVTPEFWNNTVNSKIANDVFKEKVGFFTRITDANALKTNTNLNIAVAKVSKVKDFTEADWNQLKNNPELQKNILTIASVTEFKKEDLDLLKTNEKYKSVITTISNKNFDDTTKKSLIEKSRNVCLAENDENFGSHPKSIMQAQHAQVEQHQNNSPVQQR